MMDQRDRRLQEIAYRLLRVVAREFYPNQTGVSLTDSSLNWNCDIVIERAGAVIKLLNLTNSTEPDKILKELISARAECAQLKLELEQLKSSQIVVAGEAALELMKVLKSLEE